MSAQLPVLALLWALICGAVFWRLASPGNRRLALGLLALGGGLSALVLSPSLIDHLPTTFRFIQFPYRILTYIDLCVVGLVTLALAAMERDRVSSRLPVAMLAGIALFSFGLSIDQVFHVRSWLSSRDEALTSPVLYPPNWYATLQFADGSAPVVEPTLAPLEFPVGTIQSGYRVSYPPGPAGVAETNVATGSYLVHVSGARPVGRTGDGRMVVSLQASPRHRRVVEVEAASSPAVVAGRWVTVISLVGALTGAGLVLLRRRRPRGS